MNNRGYHVQHGSDELSFRTIGFVNGQNEAASYGFTHVSPVDGINYYRLKQEDFDGVTEFSPVRTAAFSAGVGELSVYPNPVGDKLFVTGAEIDETTILRLSDSAGRLVTEQKGTNQLDVTQFPIGAYTLIVKNRNGTLTKPVVIKR